MSMHQLLPASHSNGKHKSKKILLGAVVKPQPSVPVESVGVSDTKEELEITKSKKNEKACQSPVGGVPSALNVQLQRRCSISRLNELAASSSCPTDVASDYTNESRALLNHVDNTLINDVADKYDKHHQRIIQEQHVCDKLLEALDIVDVDQQVICQRLDLVTAVHTDIDKRLRQFEDYLGTSSTFTGDEQWKRTHVYELLASVSDKCDDIVSELTFLIDDMNTPQTHHHSIPFSSSPQTADTEAESPRTSVDKITDVLNYHEEALRRINADLDVVKLDVSDSVRHISQGATYLLYDSDDNDVYFDASDVISS